MDRLTNAIIHCRLLGDAAHVLLVCSQCLAVNQNELPQTGPDGEALIRLGRSLLGEYLIQLLEDVVLDETGTLTGNVSQARLDREGKADKLFGWVTAPERVCLPNAEEAVELMHVAHQAVLRAVS